jgi:hypothetical protein
MSKNILFKISPPIWPIFEVEIEIIKKEIEKKNHITLITCDGKKKFCVANENMNKIKCAYCKKRLNDGLNFLNKFNKKKIVTFNESHKYRFNAKLSENIKKLKTTNDLLKIKYKTIDIGSAILSTLITQFNTENFSILKKKKLIMEIAKQSVCSFENFKEILKKRVFHKILIFNGRIYNYRPLLRYSQKYKLNSYCYDYSYFSHERYLIKKNDFTQNMNSRAKEIFYLHKKRRETINKRVLIKNGTFFFKNRFNKKNSGPFTVFNAVQKKALPKEYNNTINNNIYISIFPSTDFESSLVTDSTKRFIYKDQLTAIRKILDEFGNNQNVFFWIRLHPNSINDFENTKKFINLEKNYLNLKIIKPLSDISSYELVKNSSFIITFGSTIGIEAVFLKKNVISLGPSAYQEFKLDYQPGNHFETIKIISRLILNNKFNDKSQLNSIYAADAMVNQGEKLIYLKRKDMFNSYFLINGKKIKFMKFDLIYFLYFVYFITSRSTKLFKIFFTNLQLFKFKIYNYYVRIMNLLKN